MKPQLFWPVKPKKINQLFGANALYYQQNLKDNDGKPLTIAHNGIDFALNDIKHGNFAHDGTIDQLYEDSMGGWGIVVISDNEYDYKGTKAHMKTIYWHLDPAIRNMYKVGDHVTRNDWYLCDNSGFSTGPHLHFGLKFCVMVDEMSWQNLDYDNGYKGAVDPMPYFVNFYAEDGTKVESALQQLLKFYNQLLEALAVKNAK